MIIIIIKENDDTQTFFKKIQHSSTKISYQNSFNSNI